MSFHVITCCVLFSMAALGAQAPYEIERINNKQPIIHVGHFEALGVAEEEGNNINGPSLIRVPAWIPPEDRAHPNAVYYLYFAHHGGHYIRMAWASDIEGPWHLYRTGSDVPVGQRGVLDLGEDNAIEPGNGIRIHRHVASPDVHIDEDNAQIIMYFHAPSAHRGDGTGQATFVATSRDGLNFNMEEHGGQEGHGVRPVILGRFYFRVFEYNEELYAIGNFGRLYKALDPQNPWTPPEDHDFGAYLWEEGRNPFREALRADGITDMYPRHFAVRLVNNTLHAFYSRIGDRPERILLSTIDLTAGDNDWMQWEPSYPPYEVLTAEEEWEGGHIAVTASERGRVYGGVNELRDPCLFKDDDGQWYLLYSGQGEDAIGIATLNYRGAQDQ